MNITIGRGNNRVSVPVLSGKFAKGSKEALEVEHVSEDLKAHYTRLDPDFRKRSAKPKN